MDPIQRFAAYAAAFEKAYASDDWKPLEAYFTEDAVYEVFAPDPFGAKVEGRDALLAHFKRSVDGGDRRFETRDLQLVDGPEIRDGAVWMSWLVTYRQPGVPDVELRGEERAWLDGERIRRLEDRIDPASAKQMGETMTTHESKLRPAG